MPAYATPLRATLSRRAFVASASLATCALASARLARADEAPQEVVIFHTNDTHGYLQGDGSSCVGLDVVAGLRAATPNSLLLDAGDATQGAPLASLTKGQTPIELMGMAGYDAMCLGNHEFDFGQDNLLANAVAATFPVLGANVCKDGAPLLAGVVNATGEELNGCRCVLECAGRRIGVFGLTTQATAWSASPLATQGVSFEDEVACAEEQIEALAQEGVDAIVCLAHLGNGAVPCTGPDLARNLSAGAAAKLAAIIDGHSHTVENDEVNGVLVAQTGCNLQAVGKLTLSFAADGTVVASEELIDAATAAAQAQPCSEVTEGLAEVSAEQEEMLSEQLCANPTTLWAGWLSDADLSAPTRMVETNLGDLVCECFVSAASAFLAQAGLDDGTPVVAVENGGGIRGALPRGMVTMGDLVTAFPYSNTVQVKRVTPRVLRSLFEGSLSNMNGIDATTGMLLQETIGGGFLQLAGFEVTCDPNAAVGGRVTGMYVYGLGDVALDDDETPIYLASNSYVMAGGDAYEVLAAPELVAEVGGELECVRAYVDDLASGLALGTGVPSLPLLAGTQGRLVLDGCPAEPWRATLLLVDAQGRPLANTQVLLEIDASDAVEATSDAQGYVQVELEDGPHAIAAHDPTGWVALSWEAQKADASLAESVAQSYSAARAMMVAASEAYVDNHMGIGLVEDDLRAYPQLTLTVEPDMLREVAASARADAASASA